MTSVFEIDRNVVNYSYIMTYCHFPVKQGQNMLKIGTWGIFESGRTNMTSVFEIDQNFINYSYMMTYCHLPVKQGRNMLKICTWGIFESGRSIKYDISFLN